MVLGLATSGSATAGTYVIRNCNIPGDPSRPIGPWRWVAGGGTFGSDNCATGGGFGLNSARMPFQASAAVVAETGGPGITIRNVRLWMVARFAGMGSTMYVAASSGNATFATPAQNIFSSPGGETLSSPFVSPMLAPGTETFQLILLCSQDAGDCVPNVTNILEIRGAEMTLEESVAPNASVDGGELMGLGPQSGVRSLAYTATDGESGVSRVIASVGRTVVGTADFRSTCTFSALAACSNRQQGSISVDTRKLPDGIYPVSLRVLDAAGNEQTIQSPTGIQVANNAAVPTSTSPPSAGPDASVAALSALFAANRRTTLTVGYGRRVVIRGRLVGPTGDPIGGASVEAAERSRTARPRDSGLTTGTDGRFSYTLGRGTSRTLTFTYRGASILVKRLTLRVRASATLRVVLTGVTVRYRGRVLSKPLPRRGKLVEIQGKAPGADWQTFARRRTTRGGDFAGRYRLRVHRPGVQLQFRVYVPSDAGYAFVPHAGRTVTRRVR